MKTLQSVHSLTIYVFIFVQADGHRRERLLEKVRDLAKKKI